MTNEEFRRHAHAFVDWMADYLAEVERYPVRAQVKPGEIAAPPPPRRGRVEEDPGHRAVPLTGRLHHQNQSKWRSPY
ncbi:MAG: aspartate aminotransferase family protein, partial [Candidatus Rokuibacteriota bacterium]